MINKYDVIHERKLHVDFLIFRSDYHWTMFLIPNQDTTCNFDVSCPVRFSFKAAHYLSLCVCVCVNSGHISFVISAHSLSNTFTRHIVKEQSV